MGKMKAHILFGSGLELGKFHTHAQLFSFSFFSSLLPGKIIPFCQGKTKVSTKSENSDFAIFLP